MVISVSQIIEPKIVNFVPSTQRQFQTAALEEAIRKQNEARFSSIDKVELSEFAKNYLEFYKNEAADFSIENLENETAVSKESVNLVAYKLFKQADVPPTSTSTITDSKVSAEELHDFLDKADFFLNKIGVLVDDNAVNLNQYVYFATKVNKIFTEIESGDRDLNLADFSRIVKSHLDSGRIKDFEKVLDTVISFLNEDEDRPVIFNAYV